MEIPFVIFSRPTKKKNHTLLTNVLRQRKCQEINRFEPVQSLDMRTNQTVAVYSKGAFQGAWPSSSPILPQWSYVGVFSSLRV